MQVEQVDIRRLHVRTDIETVNVSASLMEQVASILEAGKKAVHIAGVRERMAARVVRERAQHELLIAEVYAVYQSAREALSHNEAGRLSKQARAALHHDRAMLRLQKHYRFDFAELEQLVSQGRRLYLDRRNAGILLELESRGVRQVARRRGLSPGRVSIIRKGAERV